MSPFASYQQMEEMHYEENARYDYIREAYGDMIRDACTEAFYDSLPSQEQEDEWNAQGFCPVWFPPKPEPVEYNDGDIPF